MNHIDYMNELYIYIYIMHVLKQMFNESMPDEKRYLIYTIIQVTI